MKSILAEFLDSESVSLLHLFFYHYFPFFLFFFVAKNISELWNLNPEAAAFTPSLCVSFANKNMPNIERDRVKEMTCIRHK